MCKALNLFEHLQSLVHGRGQTARLPTDLREIEGLLRERDYSSRSRGDALAHLDGGGSVAECESLDEADRDAVRLLLPPRLRGDCLPGCREHGDEEAFRRGLLISTRKDGEC